MRLSRFALLGTALASLAGCREDASAPDLAQIPDLAYIRYINAVPDTLNTTLRFIDHIQFVPLTFANVPYRSQGAGNYQGVRLDAHKIRIFTAETQDYSTAGNTAILVDTSLTFEKGKYYTLLHVGYARTGSTPKQQLRVIEDAIPTPGANLAIRYINAGIGLSALDLYAVAGTTAPANGTALTGTPIAANLAAGGVSPYVTRTPGAFATAATTVTGTTSTFATIAPAGLAGNPSSPAANGNPAVAAVDPVSGSTVAGSVMTAIAFPASVAGSRAASFTTPALVYFLDKQPPRYTTP
jgi:hypothetical protein